MSTVVLYRLVYVNSHNLHTGEYLEDGDLEHVLKYIEVRGGHEEDIMVRNSANLNNPELKTWNASLT